MTITEGQSKKTTTACPTCGRSFEYYRCWPRKYCSNVCKGRALVTNTGRATGTRYEASCERCAKPFMTVPSQPGRFCSQRCFGAWLSENRRGEANPRYGKPGKPPWNKGTPVTIICAVCSTTFDIKPSHEGRRRHCSKACQGAWQSANIRGEKHPTWRGGYEPYYGPSWRAAQRATRARDKVCQRCGKTPKEAGKALDVHHLIPFRAFGVPRHAEANVLTNLIAFCNVCHLAVEWETNRRQAPVVP